MNAIKLLSNADLRGSYYKFLDPYKWEKPAIGKKYFTTFA